MFHITLRFTALMSLTALFAVLGCAYAGQQQTMPDGVHFVNDLRCVTTACDSGDVHAVIGSYAGLIHELRNHAEGMLHYTYYRLRFWRSVINRTLALSIEFTPKSAQVALGDLLVYYGLPCSVTLTDYSLNLQYPDFYAMIPVDYDPAQPETLAAPLSAFLLVDRVELVAGRISCETPLLFPVAHNYISGWHGLRSVAYYLDHAQ